MSLPCWMSHMRRVSFLGFAILLAAGVASAQSTPSQDQSNITGYSSSQSGLREFAELALPNAPAPEASASGSGGSGGSAAGQYGNGGGSGGGNHGFLHNRSWAFEAGGGFNGPVGNDTNQAGVVQGTVPVITWGGNFTFGGGLRFYKRISVLAEYQFMDNKLPGALIAAVNNATGDADDISAGNAHINSITGSPVIDLLPK